VSVGGRPSGAGVVSPVAEASDPVEDEIPGRSFWIGLALGTPVMVYGAVELVNQTGWPRAFGVARWFGGGILLHDLVLVPIVLAVVWAIGRWTPTAVHTPLRAAVLGSGLILGIGWPGLRGYGNKPDNATIHPLDYSTAVLTLLALVWGAALMWSAWRLVRRADRRHPSAHPGDDPGSPRTSRTRAPG
jgi:hypothetical protein